MASVSISHIIFFIAAALVAAAVAGSFVLEIQAIDSAVQDRSEDISDDIRSDVTIINNENTSPVTEDGDLKLFVKNTGDTELPANPDSYTVLVNGSLHVPSEVTVRTSDIEFSLLPGETVEIIVEGENLNDGINNIQVNVDGAEGTFKFEEIENDQ